MHLDLYWASRFNGVDLIEDWATAFSHPRNLIVVESQDEFDFVWAMQLVYGCEIQIMHHDGSTMAEYRMKSQGMVYTTWDPSDRNRI